MSDKQTLSERIRRELKNPDVQVIIWITLLFVIGAPLILWFYRNYAH